MPRSVTDGSQRPRAANTLLPAPGTRVRLRAATAATSKETEGAVRKVVLDNGLYGETGAQTSHTAQGTDLAKVAAWESTGFILICRTGHCMPQINRRTRHADTGTNIWCKTGNCR